MKRRNVFSRIKVKLYDLSRQWVTKDIVHIWFDGWYHTTEDENLQGPFKNYSEANKALKLYCKYLDGSCFSM